MVVSFLRHAEAEDEKTSDFERKLTPKGLGQAEKVGAFCARYGLVPGLIVTSPVVRAEQTARIVARKLGDCPLAVERWLACGMSPATCLGELAGFAKFESLMLVGHEPDFSRTIAMLIGLNDSDAIQIRKSSLTVIDVRHFRSGGGRLEYVVPVRLM